MTDPAIYRDEQVVLFNQIIENVLPAAHRMGVRIVHLADGEADGEVPWEGNTNHLGTFYAGALFAVAEILGGALAFATFDMARYAPVVKEVTLSFRRPARSNVAARAVLPPHVVERVRAEADETGTSQFVVDAELTDENGEVVATSHGTYQIRRHGT